MNAKEKVLKVIADVFGANVPTVDEGESPAPGIREEDVVNAIAEFRRNDYWKRIFDEAPDGARHRLALNFYCSECRDKPGFDKAAYLRLRENLEADLSFDDLEYLIVNATKESAKQHYRDLLMNLKDDGDSDGDGLTDAQEGPSVVNPGR